MKSTTQPFLDERASARSRIAQDAARSSHRAHRFAVRNLVAMLWRSALILPAGGVALSLTAPTAFADSGPACSSAASGACQIIYDDSGVAVGHGDTGVTPASITSTFTNTQTLTAVNGPGGWGAIQLETMSGSGGAADSDGGHGGPAAWAAT